MWQQAEEKSLKDTFKIRSVKWAGHAPGFELGFEIITNNIKILCNGRVIRHDNRAFKPRKPAQRKATGEVIHQERKAGCKIMFIKKENESIVVRMNHTFINFGI